MAAPLGFKTFATGDVLTAADTNGYLMQGVWTFANAAARTAAVTSPQEGNMSYLKDTDSTEYYSGSAWVAVSAPGGSLTLLSTTSVTSATTTVSSISGAYKFLQIYIYGLGTSNANPVLSVTFNSSNLFQGWRIGSNVTTFQSAGLSASALAGGFSYSGGGAVAQFGVITINDYANTTNYKPITYNETYRTSDPAENSYYYGGKLATTSAITSMTVTWGGTTGMTGTIKIFGGN